MTFNKWVFVVTVEWLSVIFCETPDRIDIIKMKRFDASVVELYGAYHRMPFFFYDYLQCCKRIARWCILHSHFYKFQFHQVIKHMQEKTWERQRQTEMLKFLRLTFTEMRMGSFTRRNCAHIKKSHNVRLHWKKK